MDFDSLSMIYMMIILMYACGLASFFLYRYTKKVRTYIRNSVTYNYKIVIDYLRKLVVGEYFSYDKYEIWRFCVLF